MNIEEILKYCPKGTKLYSTIYGEVTLDSVGEDIEYPICINISTDKNKTDIENFTKEGCYIEGRGECTLFPSKEQSDWSKFRIPVKRGDIMMTIDGTLPFIAARGEISSSNHNPKYICGLNDSGCLKISENNYFWTDKFYIPATEEVKEKLFKAIKEAGFKWNSETLELEKIETLKFKPFDKVLVRNYENTDWILNLFSRYREDVTFHNYECINGNRYKYCITYKGNEHLLGTNKFC